jgi:DNA polymerase-3 subunit alpha/error-prone DNA polymerase
MAMTDVNNLYGAPVFWKEAIAAGIQPLLGAELHLVDDDPAPIVVLVDSQAGYANLCRMLTRLHQPPAGPRVGGPLAAVLPDEVSLGELAEGLQWIVSDVARAEALAQAGLPPRRLWLGIDPATQSITLVHRLAGLAPVLGARLVAAGPALLADPADMEAARLLAAIRTGRTLETVPPGALPHGRSFLRDGEQLARSLSEHPEAIAHNARLVERCSGFSLLPREPVFPSFPTPDGSPPGEFLHRLCREGMTRRYGPFPSDAAEARLARELRLIQRMGFSEYFLVVWDIVQYARRRGAPVAGRGSGASSIVAYTLGITNVCPIAYDIPIERFLHEQREDFPDLDVDFCWRMRDDVIDYAFRRWGTDHAAMVSMHTCFQPRSAFRESAKATGLSDEQVSRLASSSKGPDDGQVSRIAALSRTILHLPHVLSVHPGGIVITPGPLDRHAPIQTAAKGVPIVQYDKDGVEDVGLVKIDLLGNRNLSTVRAAVDLIARRRGERIDIEALAPEDPDTVATLRAARTVGCNQIESPAMRHLLRMVQPAGAKDVMQVLALIRPGAASLGMKDVFARRRRGIEPVGPLPPAAAGILAQTYGLMLYEDDVMLVAAALMDCSIAQADRFRRAVQKCHDDRQRLELSREFLSRCQAAGVDLEQAKALWVQMAKFNAYSFCRAHAGSYAVLAYAGAYLRTHYPLEFWSAAMNNNQSMYPPRVYVEQAKRDGVDVLAPDVNRSELDCTIDAGESGEAGIRLGLRYVDGLGEVTIDRILRRRAEAPFMSLSDFVARARAGDDETRSLVLCGALDSLGRSRPSLMMELTLARALQPARAEQRSLLPTGAPTLPDPPGDYPPLRKYFDQRRVLGVSVGEHVMGVFRPAIARAVDADSRDLPRRLGRRIRLAGVVEAVRTHPTRDGRSMVFVTFEDEFGLFEATLFPDMLQRTGARVDRYGPYVVTGVVDEHLGSITVTAHRVEHVEVDADALVQAGGDVPPAPLAADRPAEAV